MNQIVVTLLKDTPELKAGSIYRTYTEEEFITRCNDEYAYFERYAVYGFYTDPEVLHKYPGTVSNIDCTYIQITEVLLSIASGEGWYNLEVLDSSGKQLLVI